MTHRLSNLTALLAATLLAASAFIALPSHAAERDWYSAGMGDVDTRAFVVQVDEAQVQALLPAPLTLNNDFPGKQAGRHPLIVLLSVVMPRKAHLTPILIDMPYREFAVFIPEVMHPDLKGVFIHSTILYLDSRMAVWIGQWPYRFPKIHARLPYNEGTKFGEWRILDDEAKAPVIEADYELAEPAATDALWPAMQQLDAWFSLPLINGTTGKFTCSRMDWELKDSDRAESVRGTIRWREDWLADARRLPAFAGPVDGVRMRTLWYLSMPHSCGRYRQSN